MKKYMLIFSILFLIINNAFSVEKTWVGSKSFLFDNPQNWQPAGVPAEGDDVIIPVKSAKCSVDVKEVLIRSITIHGSLFIKNTNLLTSKFFNEGTVTIEQNSKIIKPAKTGIEFTNNGAIKSTDAELSILMGTLLPPYYYISKFENNGTIDVKRLIIKVKEIENKNLIQGLEIIIDDFNSFINSGLIKGNDNTAGTGGYIYLHGNDLINKGKIIGGKGAEKYNGGWLTIKGIGLFSHEGIMLGGDGGKNGGAGGNIEILGWREFSMTGSIYTGYYDGGYGGNISKNNRLQYNSFKMGNLTIISDSIDIFPGDSIVWAGKIHLRGQKITFDNLDAPLSQANITGFDGIEMYSSTSGIVDFFNVSTEAAVVSLYGSIDIYSDIIVESGKGINHICNPNPVRHSADGTVLGGLAFAGSNYVYAKPLDSILIVFHNHGTMVRDVQYDVTSSKGWVKPTSKSQRIEPFLFGKLYVPFTIPPNTDFGVIDFVKVIVSINDKPQDTTFGIIFCLGTKIPSIPQLISPVDNTENVDVNPQFEWIWTEADYFWLQVAKDTEFKDIIYEKKDINETEFNLSQNLEYLKDYYWRLKSILYEIESDWSSVWYFKTKQIARPEIPILISPENRAESVKQESFLLWNKSNRADSYHIQLAKNSYFTSPVLDTTGLKDTTLSIAKYLLPNTTFYWHIAGNNQAGDGQWSETWYFKTSNFTGVDDANKEHDSVFIFPNPAVCSLTIRVELKNFSNLEIRIYDLYSKEVEKLFAGSLPEGEYDFTVLTKNFLTGTYFYKVRINNKLEMGKIILLEK